MAEAWHRVAAAEHRVAIPVFQQHQAAGDPARREAMLGEAVAWLNVQPRLPGNLERARALCAEVAALEPADGWALHARYLLGRMAELHAEPPDYAAAAAHYEWLFTRHPETEIAQIARARFALVRLQSIVPPEERRARYAALRAFEPTLAHPPARRDFHLAMAEACFVYGLGRENALHHCRSAFEAGIEQPLRRATVVLRVAELACELGDRPLAREFYQRFADGAALGDFRLQYARDRLAELGAPPPEAAP
jgi:hypothetical protein